MLRATGLSKGFGGRSLFAGLDLHIKPRDRIGLVGRNGSGKTTLLLLLAGVEPPDDGHVKRRKGAEVGYLRQEVDPTAEHAVIDEARKALAPLQALEAEIAEAEATIAALGGEGRAIPPALAARYDDLRARFERAGGFRAEALLRETLTGLGLGPERWDAPLRTLSGGWLMRVELAKLLLRRPEVLLLDEPTNHLDLPSIRWFETMLGDYPGAVVVVTHDRAFLERHAERILELEAGRATLHKGGYLDYLEQKSQRAVETEARRRNLDRKIAHVGRFIERFGAKATKAAQARSRKKMLERLEAERDRFQPAPRAQRAMRVRFPEAPRSGQRVLRLAAIAKAYGDTVVYRDLDLEIGRGERIALVGPNGAGKSTLLRLAAGVLAAESGLREPGHNVRVGFYAQHALQALDPTRTVLGEVERTARQSQVPQLRGLLGAFLFSGDDVEKRVSVLSGGEKARLALAKLLLSRPNFLVLDEPTNHLDIQAQDVLISALQRFGGTQLFISHDRTFINTLANRVLEVTPGTNGARLRSFPGNYDDYLRKADGAPAPGKAERRGGKRLAPRSGRSKPTFTLRRLEGRAGAIEEAIESTEAKLERVGWLSGDPAVARDGERMRALREERAALETTLEGLYSDWERIGAEIEALERPDSD